MTEARSAGDPVPDLSGDLGALAESLPQTPGQFAALRELLSSLPGPVGPVVRSARSTVLDNSVPSDFGSGGALAGGPIGQSSGTEIGSGISGLDQYNQPALAGGGFPAAWRRYFTSGVYNGDFAGAPLLTASDFNNITNPLPYFNYVQSIGTSITAKWLSNIGGANETGSGGEVQFTCSVAGNSDEAYIEQTVPVNGSSSQEYVYSVVASVRVVTALIGPNPHPVYFLWARYYKRDGVTPTGTADTLTNQSVTGGVTSYWQDLRVTPNGGIIPVDAYFLKIQVGMDGAGATGTTGSGLVSELRVEVDGARLWLPDGNLAGATVHPPAYVEKTSGIVKINVNDPGTSGQLTSDAPYKPPFAPTIYPCSGNLVLSTTPTDVAGCTTGAFTPDYDEKAVVTAVFDVDVSAASTATTVGELVVDGVSQTAQAIFRADTTGRATIVQQWVVTLAAAVSHTLKLQGSKTVASGTITMRTPHTTMRVERWGN